MFSCDNWIPLKIDSKARIRIEWCRIFIFLEMNCGITAFPFPEQVVTLINLLISKQTLPWSQSGRLDTQYPNQDTVGDAATCSANFSVQRGCGWWPFLNKTEITWNAFPWKLSAWICFLFRKEKQWPAGFKSRSVHWWNSDPCNINLGTNCWTDETVRDFCDAAQDAWWRVLFYFPCVEERWKL